MKEFKTESKKLLDLMINSIYTNHEVFLRELISNASDALNKVELEQQERKAEDTHKSSISGEDRSIDTGNDPTDHAGNTNDHDVSLFHEIEVSSKDSIQESAVQGIHISFDKELRTLTVSDTGIGMNKASLETCLGTIAHSDSLKIKEQIAQAEASFDVDLIGQFGVGFYSSFMVADRVTVISRAQRSDEAYRWESNGVDGYTITSAKRAVHGTDVILHIRESSVDENFERYLDQTSLQNLIKRYSNYIRYPITMDLVAESYDKETGALIRDESIITREVINSMVPLWTRNEEDVSSEELNELYHFEFHDPENPLCVIRARARGAIEYDAMLFIPQTTSRDLYSKDYQCGLKLYSTGVLIDENCPGLIPDYYRFIEGIVDTNNIKLNVSREMIQEDSRIQIISRQLERSITDKLKDMIENKRQEYEQFYHTFGTGLKFAICSSQGTLSPVLGSLLLYYSAKEKRLITLQEYLDATENTKHTEVFYAVGNNIDRLSKNPQVCTVLERGHDVLLCPNGAQDELCFMLMGSYKGARFHSVTSANLKIESDETEKDEASPETTTHTRVLDALLEHSPQPLIRVDASKFLTKPDQASARVATEGIITISMAKYVAVKREENLIDKPLFVLEVNTGHTLFALAEKAQSINDKEILKNCATVLLGQALLVEDVPLADPAAFNEATNTLLSFVKDSNL